MSQAPPTEYQKNLQTTIERQRRIICDLLINNQNLRMRLMQAESKTEELPTQTGALHWDETNVQRARGEVTRGRSAHGFQLSAATL